MDKSRKINTQAGKTARYKPGETAQNFGQPNMVGKGAGISASARVPTQAHGSGGASGINPTDMSRDTGKRAAPGMSTGNMGPHPAGTAGPSSSVRGNGVRTTHLPAGDLSRRYPVGKRARR